MEEDFYDYDDIGGEPEEEEWPRDVKIDEAKEELARFFEANRKDVFYMKQVGVKFERKYFHWITGKALKELIEEGRIIAEEVPLREETRVKFIFHPRLRYYKILIKKRVEVIRRYSEPTIARGCGEQADILFMNALVAKGFVCEGQDVRGYKGRTWERTNHDLDFILERDGIVYGSEVKNTFDYINRGELETKLELWGHLQVRPLFIMRYASKSYIKEIVDRGGFAMIFEKQIYPFGQEELVRTIQQEVGLPVDCPRAIPDGIIQRF